MVTTSQRRLHNLREGQGVEKKIKITLVRSPIGWPRKQRAVLDGMGLRKINKTVILNDTAAIRGMITKVGHLVAVDECEVDA